jgi:Uma2 family endonuclease
MRAVMLEVPEKLLAERRARGEDRFDEMWEGVLHMVPPPSGWHQRLAAELVMTLGPLAKARGLVVLHEAGLYRADDDYRQPDVIFALPSQFTDRGVEGGAELVVEVRSPHDETYEKLPFYAAFGVRELLVVEPSSRAVELYVLRGGRLLAAATDDAGRLRSEVLGTTFQQVDGPALEATWGAGAARI